MNRKLTFLIRIRSLVYICVFALLTIVIGSLAILTGLISKRAAYWVTRYWAKLCMLMLRLICGLDYQVHGLHHLPKEPAVVLTQHQSMWETVAQICFLPRQTWVLKKNLLHVPFFGWVLSRCLQPIAIDRAQPKKAIAQVLEQGQQRLDNQIWVIIFPEGTRRAVGDVGRCARSGPMLAQQAKVPLVRIRHNAGVYWQHPGFWRFPGVIEVHIAPALDAKLLSIETLQQRTEQWFKSTS